MMQKHVPYLLQVVPKSAADNATVIGHRGGSKAPFFVSDGAIDLLCGSCLHPLCQAVTPGLFHDIVFVCPNCDAHNLLVRVPEAERLAIPSRITSREYFVNREEFRQRAKTRFLDSHAAGRVVAAMEAYVLNTTDIISSRDTADIAHAQHIGNLIASFVRTHFIVVDLIGHSELIEAATLLRKQFELLSRLSGIAHRPNAVAPASTATLPPNADGAAAQAAQAEDALQRLYRRQHDSGQTSREDALRLFGFMQAGSSASSTIYPSFSDNAYVLLQHTAASVLDYFFWGDPFFSEHFEEYDAVWRTTWLPGFVLAIEAMESIVNA